MRQRAPRSVRLAVGLTVGAALALAACGSESGGGSTDAFCERIQAVAESGDDTTDEENLAALQSVADAAPSEISDEMNQLVDGFAQVQSFDVEAASEEEMVEFLATVDGLDGASTAIEEFALANCPDLPADLFSPG